MEEQYEPPPNNLAFSGKAYHIFLSFRGPDVRKTLVDHLYEALTQAGLMVFLDSEKLEKGEKIGYSLDSAIESSVVRIPIFSKGYADSAWCLKEAAEMLRTPGLIIPFFYHVNPADFRRPRDVKSPCFGAFIKHSQRCSRDEVDEWDNALQQICSRSGWSVEITQGYEAQLIKKVVKDLKQTFDKVSLEKKGGGERKKEAKMRVQEEGERKKEANINKSKGTVKEEGGKSRVRRVKNADEETSLRLSTEVGNANEFGGQICVYRPFRRLPTSRPFSFSPDFLDFSDSSDSSDSDSF